MQGESKIIRVEWCNICQHAPSAGWLTVMLDGEDQPIRLDACADCAKKAFE